MYDPKVILTESGFNTLKMHLFNIKNALIFIDNHASDLSIGATDEKQREVLDDMWNLLPVLEEGDGEDMTEILEAQDQLNKLMKEKGLK